MEAAVSARFQPVLALARQYGQPLLPLPPNAPASSSSATFDERLWVDRLRALLLERERELAHAFDRVAPCFPPGWRVFDHLVQCTHVQVAVVIDLVGRHARRLSAAAQLALLEWVAGYQSTLRGLGVEEGLVRLPVAPTLPDAARGGGGVREEGGGGAAAGGAGDDDNDDHEQHDGDLSGVALLIEAYADTMKATVIDWGKKILEQDLRAGPRPQGSLVAAAAAAGAGLATSIAPPTTLRTPGAVEFFRILNEQVAVLEDVSRGELLHHVARRSLDAMRAFVEQQRAALPAAAASAGGLEMLCALLNNNLDCYAQSLAFTDHVRGLLMEQGAGAGGGTGAGGYGSNSRRATGTGGAASAPGTTAALSSSAPPLDVEDTCRAFLDLAKTIGACVVDLIFADDGMRDQTRRFFAPSAAGAGGGGGDANAGAEWEAGTATATALATLADYFSDLAAYVDPSFAPRVVEGCLQELVRCYVAAAAERLPQATDARLARMACDERDVRVFFAGAEAERRRVAAAARGGGGGRRRLRAAASFGGGGGSSRRSPGLLYGDSDEDDDEDSEEEEEDEEDGWRGGSAFASAGASPAAALNPAPWLLPMRKVARHTAAIGALCGLYASPDAKGLARTYAVVLDACPAAGLTPVVVARMLSARGDLSQAAQADAAALCGEAYALWQRRERARGRANPCLPPTAADAGGAAAAGGGGGGLGLARFFFLNAKKKEEEEQQQKQQRGAGA
jgi:hypothetical protein